MKTAALEDILDVGIAFSKEKDRESLLDKILTTAMNITGCDGGTLYMNQGDALEFRIMITRSQNIHKGGPGREAVTLPPVPMSEKNVCACGALYRQLINIPDVYQSDRYDFSGPKKYDAMTGYHTQSMMVVPMEDDKENIIGVMQLINAMDEDGNVIPFQKESEKILLSLGSQAAICLVNMNYARQIEEMLDSLVRVMSTAIDARTPYNANHTRNMVIYGSNFIDWLNGQPDIDWKFSREKTRVFLLSVWLHDVGKMVTPLEIMDKQDRLGTNAKEVEQRLEKIGLLARIRELEGKVSPQQAEFEKQQLDHVREVVDQAQHAGFLPDDLENEIRQFAGLRYEDVDGTFQPWFSEEEIVQLSIKKGTLTDEERRIMQNHVVMTRQLLEQMSFEGEYRDITTWASEHHEFINGNGYPLHLAGDEICKEVRLLTILDVFDALTAKDRPYKKPMSEEKAFEILHCMERDGEIDGEILSLFEQSKSWIDK